MKKLVLVAAIAATTFGAVSTAQAVEVTTTANANITTDYKFRGISQTNGGPAFQGGFDAAFSNGFYVGNWNSNVNFPGVGSGLSSGSAGLEMDFYGGYAGSFANGIGYDVGALYYFYEGVPVAAGSPELDTLEIYGKLSYGPVYAKLSYAATEDYFGVAAANGSIDQGGSTLGDAQYVDLDGDSGRFQDQHRVYARAGSRCLTCGKGTITSAPVGGRTTSWCKVCQR